MKILREWTRKSARLHRPLQRLQAHSSLLGREEGQDTVEFALLSSWISIAAILTLQTIGPLVVQTYRAVYFVLMNFRAGHL